MHRNKVMRKLLGQHTTASTDHIDTSVTDPLQLRPSASQNTSFLAGAPFACLDRSPDGQRAIVAGPQILKVLRVDGSTITEDFDLRAAIASHASAHDPSVTATDQLNIRTVRWSHGILDTTVITAYWNGRIMVYDLNRASEGLEVGRMKDHARAVHKLAINPFKPIWLLSASQDGTVKSFDIRTPTRTRAGLLFSAGTTFKGNADAVRDVEWSPSDGLEFACATDAGLILKWDARKPNAPVLKLSAHTSACFSISWHPDGEHLVSGGMDQHCHVWDMSKKAERNQKPRYSFTAPAPISTLSWRPACWSATAQGRRAAQVTMAYDDSNSSRNQISAVHIWDLARPGMPYKEIDQWHHAPTGILWNTRDLLWSVDSEGKFTQTDVAFVPQAVEKRSLSTFAFSPTGDVLMLLEERRAAPRARPPVNSPVIPNNHQRDLTAPLFGVSRSDSEDDVVGSFLGPRHPKGLRKRRSERSGQLSTTPPTATAMAETKVMSLHEAVGVTGIYKPQQVVAIGHAPSAMNRSVYQYFTNCYLLAISKYRSESNTSPLNIRIATIMENYASFAENVGHFRLAQTWRVLLHTIGLLLARRAEYHRQKRLAVPSLPTEVSTKKVRKDLKSRGSHSPPRGRSDRGGDTPKRQPGTARSPGSSPSQHTARFAFSDEPESTSNVATPRVQARRDIDSSQKTETTHPPLIVENDPLNLPGPAHSTSPGPGSIVVPVSETVPDRSRPSVEGYDFYGIDSFSPVTDYVAPAKKQPLRLDYSDKSPPHRIEPHRHDSSESFQMFSTSGDSQSTKYMSSSESEGRSFGRPGDTDLRQRAKSWENSFGSSAGIASDLPGVGSQVSASSDDTNFQESPKREQNGLSHVPPPFPILRLHEASLRSTKDQPPATSSTAQQKENVTPAQPHSQDPNIIASDFDPWPGDPEFTIPPIDPTVLVQRTINFEVNSGVLHASTMILLLRPLLPDDAIDDIQAPTILRAYQNRLTTLKLFTEAALLRNLCVPAYPTVFAAAQQHVTTGFFCTDCHKPIENDPLIPGSVWSCPRCKRALDACAVCKSRDIDDDARFPREEADTKLEIWFFCPGCGHGGHTACMQAWHAGPEFSEGEDYSGGCCPLDGCLHPCFPGAWRQKREEEKALLKSRELEGLVRESSRGSIGRGTGRVRSVRRDTREVNQSRAVEGVRIALNVGANSGVERRKSVKLVAPGEEVKGN